MDGKLLNIVEGGFLSLDVLSFYSQSVIGRSLVWRRSIVVRTLASAGHWYGGVAKIKKIKIKNKKIIKNKNKK